jgi:hypothetical protein
LLQKMKEPTARLVGSNMGHAVGICWFLRDVDGVPTIGHGGSANGFFAELLIVPERKFAVVSLSNAGPDGVLCNQAIVRWALQTYVGLVDKDPEPIPYDEARAQELVGSYANDVMNLTIDNKNGTGLRLEVVLKPEIRAGDKEGKMPPDHEPFDFGLLPGDPDDYIIVSGAFKGQRGFFSRDQSGAVVGVDLAGRLFGRVGASAGAGAKS